MKSFIAAVLLSFSVPVVAQTINPSQVRGTAIVQTPQGSQAITQPAGTSFDIDHAKIANLNTNGWVVPGNYGVVSGGSTNTVTATGSGSSLVLSSASDFTLNMGVMVLHGGGACGSVLSKGCASPPTPSVSTSGASGSTTYSYKLACIDGLGGVGAAGSAGSTTSGNATLAGVVNGTQVGGNYNVVTWTGNSACTEVAIYRNNVLIASEYSAPSGTMTYNDIGIAPWVNRDIPAAPPASSLNDNYIGKITAINGTSATVSPNLGVAVSSANLYHSDTPLIQAAIAVSYFVNLPPGLYVVNYPINFSRAGASVQFGVTAAIVGHGAILWTDTGEIALDVTGDQNVVLSGFTMRDGPTNPSHTGIYCSRDTTLHDDLAQNILTDHLIIVSGGVHSYGGRGGVAIYNHACEIQHNYDDQFQTQRWSVMTSTNIDHVSSPFDATDNIGVSSMSQVEFYGANGSGWTFGEIDNAYSILYIGGYGLGPSTGGHPWGFEVDAGNAGRLQVDHMRIEGKGGLLDIAAGTTLQASYLDADVYRAAPYLGIPQVRLNSGASIASADMIRSDDYGGSGGSISALVDGTNCSVQSSILRLGIFETIGSCATSGNGNTISGTTDYDRSLPPNIQLTASVSPTWMKLGTWISNSPSIGATLGLKFYTGAGFTAGANNQAVAEAFIRNANGLGSAPNLSGASLFNYGISALIGLKVVATGGSTSVTNQSWDIYVNEAAFTNGNYIVEKSPHDQWISIGTPTADPGSASSTIVVGTVTTVPSATTATPSGTCTLNGFIPMVIGNTTVHVATCN